MEAFCIFCSQTSLHGWTFLCDRGRGCPTLKKVFWLTVIFSLAVLSIYLLRDTLANYSQDTIKVEVDDRAAGLEDVYFPSIAICNVNPLRRSFIYWIQEGLRNEHDMDVIEERLFKVITMEFFKTSDPMDPEDHKLLVTILTSAFYKEAFKDFLTTKSLVTAENISNGQVFLSTDFPTRNVDLPPYDNSSALLHHQNHLQELASQWRVGQMIPFISWDGAKDGGISSNSSRTSSSAVFLRVRLGTSYGLCSWISPFYQLPPPGRETDPLALQKGALNGEQNGLSLMLDAETFDYGTRFFELGERAGEGFKAGLYHPHDMPIVQQTGVNIMPGARVLLSFSTTLINITKDAVTRFNPYERKCWDQPEIDLEYLPYQNGYRYDMNNCLYVATLQRAYKKTGCYPGYMKPSRKPCIGKELSNFNFEFSNLGMHRDVLDGSSSKHCMAACRDQTFFTSESTALFPARETFRHTPAFCHVVKKLGDTCGRGERRKALENSFPGVCQKVSEVLSNRACEKLYTPDKIPTSTWDDGTKAEFAETMLSYTRQNVALVTVFMNKPYCVKILQEVKFTTISLIGNIGGILGLCLGGSLVSLVEMVWFCLRGVLATAPRRCQKSKGPEEEGDEK